MALLSFVVSASFLAGLMGTAATNPIDVVKVSDVMAQ